MPLLETFNIRTRCLQNTLERIFYHQPFIFQWITELPLERQINYVRNYFSNCM